MDTLGDTIYSIDDVQWLNNLSTNDISHMAKAYDGKGLSMKEGGRDFLGHFLCVCPKDMPPAPMSDERVDEEAINQLFKSMVSWQKLPALAQSGKDGAEDVTAPIVTMEAEANDLLVEYVKSLHRYEKEPWGKYAGEQASRLVFMLHCLECSANGEPNPLRPVTVQTVQGAIAIYDALCKHNEYVWAKIDNRVYVSALLPYIEEFLVEDAQGLTFSFVCDRQIMVSQKRSVSCFKQLASQLNKKYGMKLTKEDLSQSLIKIGFTEERVPEGLAYTISKEKYIAIKEQLVV